MTQWLNNNKNRSQVHQESLLFSPWAVLFTGRYWCPVTVPVTNTPVFPNVSPAIIPSSESLAMLSTVLPVPAGHLFLGIPDSLLHRKTQHFSFLIQFSSSVPFCSWQHQLSNIETLIFTDAFCLSCRNSAKCCTVLSVSMLWAARNTKAS